MDKILFDQTVAIDLYLKSQYNKNINKKLINYLDNTQYKDFWHLKYKRFLALILLLIILALIQYFLYSTTLLLLFIITILISLIAVISSFTANILYYFIIKILIKIFNIDKKSIEIKITSDFIRLFDFNPKSLFKNNIIPTDLNKYLKFFILLISIIVSINVGLIFFIKQFLEYISSITYDEYYYGILILLFLLFIVVFAVSYFVILFILFFGNNSPFRTIIEILRIKGIYENSNYSWKNVIVISTIILFYSSILLLIQTTNLYYALIEAAVLLVVPLLTVNVSYILRSTDFYKVKVIEILSLFLILIFNCFGFLDQFLYIHKFFINFDIVFILILLIASTIIETIKVENSWKKIIDSLNKIKNNRNECFIDKEKTIECYNKAIDYSNGSLFLSEHEYIQKLLDEINLKEVLTNLRNYNHLTYQTELIKSIQFDGLISGILDENVSKIHYFKIQLYEKLEKQNIEIIQLKHYKRLLKEILNNPEKLIMYFVLLIIPLYIIIVFKESGLTGLIEAVKTLFKSYFFP